MRRNYTSKVGGEDREDVDRRAFVIGAGVIPAVSAMAISGEAVGSEWARFASAQSGAVIRYPARWTVESTAEVNLLYPHQSFAAWNGPHPARSSDEFPSLASYPRTGIYMWLLHYSDVRRSSFAPEFKGFSTFRDLATRVSEFGGFARYGAAFSGSKHSYLLRLWVGEDVSRQTLRELDRCTASLSVPQ